MTDYTKTTDFAAKDSLPSGDSGKIIKGTEFETEFDNIATAIATKSNIASPTFTGTTTIPTVDINGGAIDAVTLGTNSAVTEAQVDNININGNTISSSDTNGNVNISPNGTGTVVINTDLDVDNINVNGNAIISTDTNGNIDLTPNGTGEVNISKVDIDSGAIDGTVIGAASAAAITGTTGQFNTSLNVDGTVTADGLTIDGGATIQSSTGGVLTLKTTDTAGASGEDVGSIDFYNSDVSTGSTGVQARILGEQDSAGDSTALQFFTGFSSGSGDPTLRKRIQISGASGTNGDISFYEDTGTTAKLYWDASAESLGIGTASPSSLQAGAENLVVGSGLGDEGMTIYSGTANRGNIYFADGTTGSEPYRGQINYFHDSDYLRFVTAAAERMRIDSSGNVGIGTASPASLIHGMSGDLFLTANSTAADSGQGIYFQSTTSGWTTSSAHGAIFGKRVDASNGYLRFDTRSSGTTAERMRVDASGNLLVGKTAADSYNTTNGIELQANGLLTATRTGIAQILNREDSDGDIAVFRKDGATVGSIGSEAGGYLSIGNADTGLSFLGSVDAIGPYSPSALDGRDAAIDLGTTTRRFKDLYLSGGVYVGGTGAANKLDDYEEGTWTASIKYDNPSTGTAATLSESGGTYTKVGRLVTVNAEIDVSSTNSGTGNVYILGLPFTVADLLSPTGQEANGLVGYYTGFSSGVNSLTVGAENLTTYMSMYGLTSSTQTATSNITAAIMGTGELRLSLTYFTT